MYRSGIAGVSRRGQQSLLKTILIFFVKNKNMKKINTVYKYDSCPRMKTKDG